MIANTFVVVNGQTGGPMATKRAEAASEECCASVLDAPLDEAEAVDLARAFAALSDPVRLRLLSLIADSGEVCACELLEPLGKAQPTVSHHTKALADAGLIVGAKRGRWVWWSIVPERVAMLGDALVPARARAGV
jgi:ArsR family transcriptional regulator, arsenate/arsenite/antimonite-responsive transcriptional repressor